MYEIRSTRNEFRTIFNDTSRIAASAKTDNFSAARLLSVAFHPRTRTKQTALAPTLAKRNAHLAPLWPTVYIFHQKWRAASKFIYAIGFLCCYTSYEILKRTVTCVLYTELQVWRCHKNVRLGVFIKINMEQVYRKVYTQLLCTRLPSSQIFKNNLFRFGHMGHLILSIWKPWPYALVHGWVYGFVRACVTKWMSSVLWKAAC